MFDDVYGEMCGESNVKNGALEIDFSTTALPIYCQNGSDMSFVGQEPAQNGQAGCKALEE
jgi:hypothetical protein